MGTLILLFCRTVLGYNAMGGDYQAIALTASLDTIAILCYLIWKRQKSLA